MLGISTTHHILDTIVSLVSIVFNLKLFGLIWNHSDFKVKAYKWILLITCVGDICLGTVVLIGQPAILFGDGYMVAVANGFFANKSRLFDHFCASIYCALLHANITCVVVQFIFRWRLICGHEKPFGNPLLFILPIAWCLFQAFSAAWCFVIDDTEELREAGIEVLRAYNWNIDNSSLPYPAVSGAITPLFTSMGPTLFVVGSMMFGLGQTLPMVFVFVSMGMTFITVANPITTIYFVKPYRKAFLNSFGIQFKDNSIASSTQNNTQNASNELPQINRVNRLPPMNPVNRV